MIFERTMIDSLYTPYSIYFRMVVSSSGSRGAPIRGPETQGLGLQASGVFGLRKFSELP